MFYRQGAQIIPMKKTEEVAVNFTNQPQGPTVMHEHILSMKVIIKGQNMSESIIDGGSIRHKM